MKLFYKPASCSMATHIALVVADHDYELVKVDTQKGLTATGETYSAINPKGSVPAVQLDSGEFLTEGVAILQYIADQYPDTGLAPPCNTMARTRLHEQLNYISSELHKAFAPLFNPNSSDQEKKVATKNVEKKLKFVNNTFSDGKKFLLNDQLTVADIYLFVVCNWTQFVGISLDQFTDLKAFMNRMKILPAVQNAMKKEGLIN